MLYLFVTKSVRSIFILKTLQQELLVFNHPSKCTAITLKIMAKNLISGRSE